VLVTCRVQCFALVLPLKAVEDNLMLAGPEKSPALSASTTFVSEPAIG